MPQNWQRLGLVFCSQNHAPWMKGYASYPTPLALNHEIVRVYFSPRDAENRSSIAWLDLRICGEKFEITAMADQPLLSPGSRGAFDDSGVTVSCVVPDGDQIKLYYLGWSLSVTVPFRNFIGLAAGNRNAMRLDRISLAPIMDRSSIDPYTLGYPWVLPEQEGWRMWYGSHLKWGAQGLDMLHVIKEAHSRDGLVWQRGGRIAIPVTGTREYAVSRPCVLRDADCYRMWFARKDPDYRMGYAESADGNYWRRQDDAVIFNGLAGDWESSTQEYATVFDHGGRRYMLYNANGYGRSGFGMAILEKQK